MKNRVKREIIYIPEDERRKNFFMKMKGTHHCIKIQT